jgi:site-specific DNA recombinase
MARVNAAPAGMVVLGALRKSVVRKRRGQENQDELAASLELQQKKITAHFPDGTPFIWATDPGVSGAVSPFKRPDVGPKLADLDSWTHLAVARFDRVSRSVRDFSDLIEWLRKHGKLLVCLDPPIDLSTPGGRAFAQMLAVFAEYERELIRERVADSWHDLKDAGKWPGGVSPFGRIPVQDGDNWRLAADPEYQAPALAMALQYIEGASFRSIAADIKAQGIPMPRDVQRVRAGRAARGKGWTGATVKKVLSSPYLGGFIPAANGDVRRDADNVAIRIDPLIPEDVYERLQVAMRERAQGRNMDASGLLGVVHCFLCSAPMYATSGSDEVKTYPYYICQNYRDGGTCKAGRIPMDYLEDRAAGVFLAAVGDQKILEPVYIAAVDHDAELADVTEAMENLEAQVLSGKVYKGEEGAKRFASLMARLEERRDRLAAIASTPARTEYRQTDMTFAEKWAASDRKGRRLLMSGSGFRVYFARVLRDPEEVARDIRALGFAKTAKQLRTRESHARTRLTTTKNPAVTARIQAELTEIVEQRRQLNAIPRYHEYMAAPVGPELARRAGLAAAGHLVDLPDNEETWEQLLAPARQVLRRPRPVS